MSTLFRMPIDAVFSIGGPISNRTIVTGTIEHGTVTTGVRVDVVGGAVPRVATVLGIEVFRKRLSEAGVGQAVGLELSGVTRADVAHGYVLVSTSQAQLSSPAPPVQTEAAVAARAARDRFTEVEREYARLRRALDAGEMTNEALDAKLLALAFEHEGRYWMIGANTGDWYGSSGNSWVCAVPPGRK